MKYLDVCSMRKFEENGEEKKKWYKIGYVKETPNGGRFLTLFQQPDTAICIFDQNVDEE